MPQFSEEIPEHLTCPITGDLMHNPAYLEGDPLDAEGRPRWYERSELERWVSANGRSPLPWGRGRVTVEDIRDPNEGIFIWSKNRISKCLKACFAAVQSPPAALLLAAGCIFLNHLFLNYLFSKHDDYEGVFKHIYLMSENTRTLFPRALSYAAPAGLIIMEDLSSTCPAMCPRLF